MLFRDKLIHSTKDDPAPHGTYHWPADTLLREAVSGGVRRVPPPHNLFNESSREGQQSSFFLSRYHGFFSILEREESIFIILIGVADPLGVNFFWKTLAHFWKKGFFVETR